MTERPLIVVVACAVLAWGCSGSRDSVAAGHAEGPDGAGADDVPPPPGTDAPIPPPPAEPDDCGGLPIVVADGQKHVEWVAVDDEFVFWHTFGDLHKDDFPPDGWGRILRAPRCGGRIVVLADALREVGGMTSDAGYIYWTDRGACGGMCDSVRKIPKTGGTPAVVASSPKGPGPIAVDASAVYWRHWKGLSRVAKAGGEVLLLISAYQFPSEPIFVHEGLAYWFTDLALQSVPATGGPVTTLAAVPKTPSHAVLSGKFVYWEDGPTAWRLALAGGTPVIVRAYAELFSQIAVDGDRLYWTDGATGEVLSAIGQGPLSVVASGLNGPAPIQVHGPRVYVGELVPGGRVLSFPK